ncbi:MAG: MATE family efflux transporter [Roseburia sp.]
MTKDMTSGSPMKLVLGFSVPLLFGFLFQQFYNLMDTLIVGKVLGVDALAAVGATGSLNFLIIGFCMGVCSGFSIPLAHRFGAGDYSAMRAFMMNAVYLSAGFALIMMVVTVIFCRPILELMQTPDNIIDQAYLYIVVIFIGIPATYLYNLISGIIRAMGDSKTPLIFLAMAAVLNIILDLVLILFGGMGVSGAAIATVISQGVSGICCLIYSSRRFEILKTSKNERRINPHYMRTLCGMGVPMGLQYSVTAIGSVILQRSVNTLGSDAVASVTAGTKVSMFFCCPFDALGSTIATYGGQNVGARRLERIPAGLKACSILGIGYAILAFFVMLFAGNSLALFFVKEGQTQVIGNVAQFLLINSAFYIPLVFVNVLRFLIQGMGFGKLAILAGVFEMVARTLVGFVFVPLFGYTAACFANPIAWVFANIFLFPAYFYVFKKTRKLLNYEEQRMETAC